MKKLGLSKSEIISKKDEIQRVFKEKNTVKKYPLLIYFIRNEEKFHRIIASVPKRNFKKAVDRNQLKRRIKEIWRQNKTVLETENSSYFDLFIIYTAKEEMTYSEIEAKFILLLKQIK